MKRIALGSVVTVGMGVVACGGAPRLAAAQPQQSAGIAAPALAAHRELDVRTPDGLTLHAWSTGDERAPVVLVVVPKAGHFPWVEQGDAFFAALDELFRGAK
jgi:pimeloyl-ACP methyl ester carboxylesterase